MNLSPIKIWISVFLRVASSAFSIFPLPRMLSDTTQEVFGSWLCVWWPYVIHCSLGCNFFLSMSAAHSVIYMYCKDFSSLSLLEQRLFLECWAGSRLSGYKHHCPWSQFAFLTHSGFQCLIFEVQVCPDSHCSPGTHSIAQDGQALLKMPSSTPCSP